MNGLHDFPIYRGKRGPEDFVAACELLERTLKNFAIERSPMMDRDRGVINWLGGRHLGGQPDQVLPGRKRSRSARCTRLYRGLPVLPGYFSAQQFLQKTPLGVRALFGSRHGYDTVDKS